jgi:hypothetical protein
MSLRRVALLLAITTLALSAVASAGAAPNANGAGPRATTAAAPEAEDEAVVLPSRIAYAIRRTETALTNAEEHIDEAEYTKAITSLRAVRQNLARAEKAARRQMNTVPADPEAETTPGPDAVIAVLNLDQEAVTRVAGLFNSNTGTLVTALASTMAATQLSRDRLLNTVIALDPEGAGVDYADGMADTLDGYADEVANISEAIADDKLSTGGATALRAALARSNATLAKVNAAYGGGE